MSDMSYKLIMFSTGVICGTLSSARLQIADLLMFILFLTVMSIPKIKNSTIGKLKIQLLRDGTLYMSLFLFMGILAADFFKLVF